jgi:hypothetical protein
LESISSLKRKIVVELYAGLAPEQAKLVGNLLNKKKTEILAFRYQTNKRDSSFQVPNKLINVIS